MPITKDYILDKLSTIRYDSGFYMLMSQIGLEMEDLSQDKLEHLVYEVLLDEKCSTLAYAFMIHHYWEDISEETIDKIIQNYTPTLYKNIEESDCGDFYGDESLFGKTSIVNILSEELKERIDILKQSVNK